MKVLIDPGHRNNINDFGACGNGYKESELALQISKKLKNKLEKHGIICYLTRESEADTISVSTRPQKAITLKTDLLISIHINSAGTTATGIEVLYKNEKELASIVCNAMCNATAATNRGAKLRTDLGVLNGFKQSILIECGFISNPYDAKKLADNQYQEKLTTAIADAIVERYKIVVNHPAKEVYAMKKIKVIIDGEIKEVDAINVDGNNFIKLRDLESARIDVDFRNGMPIINVI